ncbi:hypothetical protein OR571_09505 [Psychrobacillus sp. NEAU-3TGS]|uniref:hypothetical protein n=1 Tax=Psychrobacillus sp. NEAU-3TGS TaxID=2995412 RepID=UPI0024969FB4|nr:hypothetical protein [Psychrobacillus sp. NEAU-3TGS]MDI2587330.1 hypothetical protein [Psychrobacillus sp. NEAU-3TGS]
MKTILSFFFYLLMTIFMCYLLYNQIPTLFQPSVELIEYLWFVIRIIVVITFSVNIMKLLTSTNTNNGDIN